MRSNSPGSLLGCVGNRDGWKLLSEKLPDDARRSTITGQARFDYRTRTKVGPGLAGASTPLGGVERQFREQPESAARRLARLHPSADRFGHRAGDVQSETATGTAAAVLVGPLKQTLELRH